jgi:D-alanyl-D-alanine carboxypeptidase
VLAGPQHRATTRAPRSTSTRGRRRAATPTRSRKTDTTGRHRAASGSSHHPGRRLTLSTALALAAVAAPTAWATDLIGPTAPAPASTASDALPQSEPDLRADDAVLPGVVAPSSIQKKDHRTNRQPPVSRGGSVRAQPQLPDWLATCDTTPAKTSEANGLISDNNLCEMPTDGLHLRGDAAQAWWRLSESYHREFDEPLCMTDAYRSLDAQQRLSAAKPGLAARPGTSNHGWGVAIDLCGGAETYGTAEYTWLMANADDTGWTNPTWAQQGGSKPEPWHWEYAAGSDLTPS